MEEMMREEQGGGQTSEDGREEQRWPSLEIKPEVNQQTEAKSGQAAEEFIEADEERKGGLEEILAWPAVRKAGLLTIRYSKSRTAEKARLVVSCDQIKEIVEFKKEDWAPYL